MKKILISLAALLVAGAVHAETKYATHATLSAVNYKAADSGYIITAVIGESDKATSDVLVYGRTGNPIALTAAVTNGATVLPCVPASAIASNDTLMVQHASGTVDYLVASAATATNITVASGVSAALTTGAKIYEVTTIGRIMGAATNLQVTGTTIFETPTDSPLRVTLDSTSAGWIAVTAKPR